jgi:aminopeptidase-like protein
VSREDLLAHHVVTDPDRPDEIVYHYRNGFQYDVREWGFSLPYRVVASLGDESYQVEIDADLDDEGSVKVVDAYLPGALPETLFFMAHTCHPAQVSDGIGSIAVAVELFHDLKALPHRRYSYRFLFGPEYFAAAAYLTKAGSEAVGNLHLGCYLDMMTTHEPLGFQASMQGDSRLDKVAANVMQSHLTTQVGRPFRGLWGNDETFYNGPGYNIPTIGIGRVMHREYHYDSDNLDNFSAYRAVESVWILKRIVEVFETDYLPVREYQGPLYLSRFGLYVDPVKDRVGAVDLERMQVLMDGRHSCMDIAEALGMDFFFVRNLCDKMAGFGLVSKAPRPPREGDRGSR